MANQLTTLTTRLRRYMSETATTEYSDARVQELMQLAMRDLFLEIPSLSLTNETITIVADTGTYTLSASNRSMLVKAVEYRLAGHTDLQELPSATDDQLRGIYGDAWRQQSAPDPTYWTMDDASTLRFVPIPSALPATNPKAWYATWPADINNTTDVLLPEFEQAVMFRTGYLWTLSDKANQNRMNDTAFFDGEYRRQVNTIAGQFAKPTVLTSLRPWW